uniref:Piwi domain-containing protein n=1 Tax=Globodera rostochiensis TaxID=31243 RepID=A0A914HTL6_GLORO
MDLLDDIQNLNLGANIPQPAAFNKYSDGFANIYTFAIRPTSHGGATVFRYDVELTQLNRNKSLTSVSGDDGKNGLLRSVCYALIKHVHTSTRGFGSEAEFVYDNRKNMFTNKPINLMAVEVNPEHVPGIVRDYLRGSPIMVEIKACQTGKHDLDLNATLSSLAVRPEDQSDRSIHTFLEMLTTQPFINAGSHDMIGAGRLFKRKVCKELDDGIVTREGIAKGVRIIGNDGVPKAALVADVKTCAFFGSKNLEEIVLGMLNKRRVDLNNKKQLDMFWPYFNLLFRGVSGYLTYAPSRVVVIDSVTLRSTEEISFDVDGQEMTMVDFFMKKKSIPVNAKLPAIRQQQDREALFPMSCIFILPNQRVPIEKMSDFISRELLAANTTLPAQRHSSIERALSEIGAASAQFMALFGVKLSPESSIKVGIHEMPKVKFGSGVASFQDKISPSMRYLEPTDKLKAWIVAYPMQVDEKTVSNFVAQLKRMGEQKGMTIPQPTLVRIELAELNERMKEMTNRGIQFLLYVDKKFVKSHAILKLTEKRFGLLTQHVTSEVASNARPMTLSNVLNKMNMKLFGYNYMPILSPEAKTRFNMEAGDVLVIGVDTSCPSRATPFEKFMLRSHGMAELRSEDPMTVGICANYVVNAFKFCGDYYFQPYTKDVLQPDLLQWKLGQFLAKVKTVRTPLPSIVFIIRDGVSEGAIQNNVRDEFPTYVRACQQVDVNWRPKFVYCVVDKKHNKRFYLRDGEQTTNTHPGCAIDSKVTRVDVHEFWLQAHVPLKGTARIPQYVFPINQVSANNNELQSFLLTLCCNWQIVTLAPALPTPVRQAAELAKRGRNNYMELKRNSPQFIPRLPNGSTQIDISALNMRLCYENSLAMTRFNA